MSVRVVLVAARDEEARIAATVTRLRDDFPRRRSSSPTTAPGTALRPSRRPRARASSGFPARQGTNADARRAWTASGPILVCDADVEGDLRPLAESAADLSIGVFAERLGGGFGIAEKLRGR